MGIAERNAAWTGGLRTFQQDNSRSSSARIWTVSVQDGKLVTVWGQKDGAMQTASEAAPAVNEGKKNYISPEKNAIKLALRHIELKTREGYREVDSRGFLDQVSATAIDFSKPLPQELCFWKPVNATEGKMLEKANSGKAWFARKRNGMAMVICHHANNEIQIYSRRMLRQHDDETNTNYTWNDRFHTLAVKAQEVMPKNSIMLGELIVEWDGKERFDLAQSYIKCLTPEAKQRIKEFGEPFFYCWDIPFWDGEEMARDFTVQRRYELINEVADWPIIPVEVFPGGHFKSTTHAIDYAKKKGWEGFVVVDPDGVFGDRAYNFKGKPDRPPCATKLKPSFEDDFVAMWNPEKGYGERSTKGSRAGGIKSVGLFQYNSRRELMFICNVSSGLTKEDLVEWADPKKFPAVWQIEYTSRTYIKDGDDTNALIFPRFVMARTDKNVQECVNGRL